MAATTYEIVTNLRVNDKGTQAVKAMKSSTDSLGRSMLQAVTLGNLLGNAIGRAFGGAVQAVRSLAREMVALNKEFEDQRLNLTALVNANLKFQRGGRDVSPAQNLAISKSLAETQIKQFQQAAKTSPGSTRDFAEIGAFALDPFLKAGGKLGQDFTDFIKKTLIAGQLTGQAQDVTARDAQQLLQGLSTSRDKLPKLLGLDPESINKLKPDERLKKINEALSRVVTPETMGLIENSFTAISATFEDMVDIIKRSAGEDAFASLKETLISFNSFLEKNEAVLSGAIGTTIEAIRTGFGTMFSVLETVFFPISALVEFLGEDSKAAEAARASISANLSRLNEALNNFSQTISGVNTPALKTVGDVMVSVVNAVLFAMQSLVDGLSIAAASIQSIASFVTAPLGISSSIASTLASGGSLYDGIKSGINTVTNKVSSPLVDVFGGIKKRVLGGGANKSDSSLNQFLNQPFQSRLSVDSGSAIGGGGGGGGGGGRATPKIQNNFYGDININQDFKENADPDRVAVSVKKVLERMKARPTETDSSFRLFPRIA